MCVLRAAGRCGDAWAQLNYDARRCHCCGCTIAAAAACGSSVRMLLLLVGVHVYVTYVRVCVVGGYNNKMYSYSTHALTQIQLTDCHARLCV